MDDTKTLIFKINEKLKDDFKIACIRGGSSQQDAIESLVKLYVDVNGNLKKLRKQ